MVLFAGLSACKGNGAETEESGGGEGQARPAAEEAARMLRGLSDRTMAYWNTEQAIDPDAVGSGPVIVVSGEAVDDYQTLTVTGRDADGQAIEESVRLSGTTPVQTQNAFSIVEGLEMDGVVAGWVTVSAPGDLELGEFRGGSLRGRPTAGPLTLTTWDSELTASVTVRGQDPAGQPIEETVELSGGEARTTASFGAVLDATLATPVGEDIRISDAAGEEVLSVSSGNSAALEELEASFELPYRFPYGAGYDFGYTDPGEPRMSNVLPVSAPRTPETVPCGEPAAVDPADWQHPTWQDLGFSPPDPHHFSYQFDSGGLGRGASFTVYAFGDVDCDGVYSTFVRSATLLSEEDVRGGEMTSTNPDE